MEALPFLMNICNSAQHKKYSQKVKWRFIIQSIRLNLKYSHYRMRRQRRNSEQEISTLPAEDYHHRGRDDPNPSNAASDHRDSAALA
jgi:hypothetical protein